MQVHLTGAAIVGLYPKGVAETKISLAKTELKNSGYPLRMRLLGPI